MRLDLKVPAYSFYPKEIMIFLSFSQPSHPSPTFEVTGNFQHSWQRKENQSKSLTVTCGWLGRKNSECCPPSASLSVWHHCPWCAEPPGSHQNHQDWCTHGLAPAMAFLGRGICRAWRRVGEGSGCWDQRFVRDEQIWSFHRKVGADAIWSSP